MEQLLRTKFNIPPTRPKLVYRPRLIEQMNEGLYRKLTLISAPAGFGKTTLVNEWIDGIKSNTSRDGQSQYKIAWLSLDENDNDETRFLTYFTAALTQIDGGSKTPGKAALGMIQSPAPPPAEITLTSLINEINALSEKIIFVLDDYHQIDASHIHNAVAFFLENQPPEFHLIIATREDPQLPLSRLRGRGQLTELRAADLRFTSIEATEFLNYVMGLHLSPGEVNDLENRTEGWIAGLQLAAISLRGKEDTTELIKSFSGSHRLVLDYLIEEVLDQQPESIQNFLLQTAILDQLTGPLCDAVTGQGNGQATLEYLDQSNLFIVPVDNERKWYRYHHLFADLLLQRSKQTYRELSLSLHKQASEWYEQNGLTDKAVGHALKARDFDRAANLVEASWGPMNSSYRSVTWLGWAKSLPDELVRSRPFISSAYGWALLDTGYLDAADHRFRDAERWLSTAVNTIGQDEDGPDRLALPGEEDLQSLRASIANGRAYLSQAHGDLNGTLRYAQEAIDLLQENNYFELGLSEILKGFAFWASGKLEAAQQAIAESIANLRMTGNLPFIISFTSYLADVLIAQGRLRQAENTYLQLLDYIKAQDEPEIQEMAVLHLGLSEIYIEQGNMDAASQHLCKSDELGELPSFPPWFRHWTCAHIREMENQADFDGVIKILSDAERLYYRHPIPDIRPLKAFRARAWISQGKLEEAQNWVQNQGLSIGDDLSYLDEFEHITMARLLIAQYKNYHNDDDIQDALELLERLSKAAEEGGRNGSMVEILMLQALAYQAQNDMPSALASLKAALTTAMPECCVGTFIREGAPMAALLNRMKVRDRKLKEYINKLLTFFGAEDSQFPCPGGQPLVEPLSDRELEVLQLISEGLTNQEIGSSLYLSLNTVKAHTRNIYGKLGVNSRVQAVSKAKTLGILVAA